MKSFTLLEILIIIGIIAILISLTLPLSLDFYRSQQLETHSQGIIQTLRQAQLKAMAQEADSSFGVYLTDESYILFKGNSYFTRDPQYDEIFDLPIVINVGGLSEILFSKLSGSPSVTGSIIIGSGEGEQRIITINQAGRINLEH